MTIANSTIDDLPEIFNRYQEATAFQKIKFPENHWPEFDKGMIANEISENRQFKLLVDKKIACVWAIAYSDPQIWEDDDGQTSIFIHRIATNPQFRGRQWVKTIVAWASNLAKTQNRRYIRMDTCGINQGLITYYTSCGFNFLGARILKNPSHLPSHYHHVPVCFFEIDLS